MGKISAGSWSYNLSSEDKLWAARMTQFEGGDHAATLWTMTQAYAQLSIHRAYPTFTKFIQAYSQPINPAWALGGSRCPSASSDASSPCSETRLRRRAQAATMPLSAVSPSVRAAVESWYAGTLANPVPKAVEFADNTVGQNYINAHAGARAVARIGGNIYIATASSDRWPSDYVRMSYAASTVLLAVVLGGAAGVSYCLWKNKKETGKFYGLASLRRPR